jgi:hypothetical protein
MRQWLFQKSSFLVQEQENVMEHKTNIDIVHSAHLDLYWIGAQAVCLKKGAQIIDDAVQMALDDESFSFFIETVRFLEYYLSRYPHRKEELLTLIKSGRIEIGAAYTDRLENCHDGESMLRNAVYGKSLLRRLLGIDTPICYHPDLPGLSEQTPQIYSKAGVKYYLFARGFKNGARFWWKALDDSKMIAYNFPIHYSYYSIEENIIPFVENIQKEIQSKDLLIACSSGDLGKADTFISKEDGCFVVKNLRTHIKHLNDVFPCCDFHFSGALAALEKMDESSLPEKYGEAPSRWGQGSEAQRVEMFALDRKVAAALYEAEVYTAVCSVLGVPVKLEFPVHPLENRGSSGGKRQYFDLEITPETTAQWLEYAWRLQLVTQDHNYGGIDGAQTNFDKLLYKKVALQIAQEAIGKAFEQITPMIKAAKSSAAVFNCLNWKRNEAVKLPEGICTHGGRYIATTAEGETAPVVEEEDGFYLLSSEVPSVGYKTYQILTGDSQWETPLSSLKEDEEEIRLQNQYWKLAVNKRDGTVSRLYDKRLQQELADGSDLMAVYAYADMSSGVDERAEDRKLLDDSRKHVRRVFVKSISSLEAYIRIESEICGNKVLMDVKLNHVTGQLHFMPKIFWNGIPNLQIKLALPIGSQLGGLKYGVAYGQQTYGKYIEPPDFIATDEIDPLLYERYRKVIGWYAYSDEEKGMAMILEHGTMDFNTQDVGVTLIRDTRNCGDLDVISGNEGTHEWQFTVETFCGRLEDFNPSRRVYERIHPLRIEVVDNGEVLESCESFLDTDETGILTALRDKGIDKPVLEARIYNESSEDKQINLRPGFSVSEILPVDLLGNVDAAPVNILAGYEIKTLFLKLKGDESNE